MILYTKPVTVPKAITPPPDNNPFARPSFSEESSVLFSVKHDPLLQISTEKLTDEVPSINTVVLIGCSKVDGDRV